jgi:RNA polymerase sigma-70 factor (ECF subfamily)
MCNHKDCEKTDNELMLEFKGCSRSSFNIIFHRYKQRLYNFVLRNYLCDKDDAEEIVQKTFIKVFQYKYKYKPINQFNTWLYTIARNLSINELNRKKKLVALDNEDDLEMVTGEFNQVETDDSKNIILELISGLKPKYREVLVMRYIEELSYEEIYQVTGTKISTLKSLSKRGLEQIKAQLERCGIEKEQI